MSAIELPEVEVYTDGSCYPNPDGPGGWAFVVHYEGKIVERYGHLKSTTNNVAELTAIKRALFFLHLTEHPVKIYTDSNYAKKSVTTFYDLWQRSKWINSIGQPVANKRLIKEVRLLIELHRRTRDLSIVTIRGHAGNPFNERADELAGRARIEKIFFEKGCGEKLSIDTETVS